MGTSAMEGIHMVGTSALYHAIHSNVQELRLEHHRPLHTASVSCKKLHRHGMYSKEQWGAMKPLIWNLYNVQKKTLKEVMEILRDEYDFSLTRRQLIRKICEWGYTKNTRKEKRQRLTKTPALGYSDPANDELGPNTYHFPNGPTTENKPDVFKSHTSFEEFPQSDRSLSASPVVGIIADTLVPTSVNTNVLCINPSLTSYQPPLGQFEWEQKRHEVMSIPISQDANAHLLITALRNLVITPITYDLLRKWDLTKKALEDISENDRQMNKPPCEQGHWGRHHRHVPEKSIPKAMVKARIDLVKTRECLSSYLHGLRCSYCYPRIPKHFEGSEERYPIFATANDVINLYEASRPDESRAELLHYCWCLFNSIYLPYSNYQYQFFAETLFRLLVEEFSEDTLAGKSVCIDIARYYLEWGEIRKAINILKRTLGQEFGFVLRLSQLEASERVDLYRRDWNEEREFQFGPHWKFSMSPRIPYDVAVTILQSIRKRHEQSWDDILEGEFSHTNPDKDWTQISDLAEHTQNRIPNTERALIRTVGKKYKRRLEDLARRAESSEFPPQAHVQLKHPADKQLQDVHALPAFPRSPRVLSHNQYTPLLQNDDDKLFSNAFDRDESHIPPLFAYHHSYTPPEESVYSPYPQPLPYRTSSPHPTTESYSEYIIDTSIESLWRDSLPSHDDDSINPFRPHTHMEI